MEKNIRVDFALCHPSLCGESGVCRASLACTRKLLLQEEPGEPPMLMSMKLCSACGKCIAVCPLNAISNSH